MVRVLMAACAVAGVGGPLNYEQGIRRSLETGAPLVVFVGTPHRIIAGAVTCRATVLADYPAQCVVVAAPVNGRLVWIATLSIDATDGDISSKLPRRRVQAAPENC